MTQVVDRILRPAEVARRCGVSRPTLYLWRSTNPEFPKSFKIGPRAVGWRESEVEFYLSRQEAAA